MYSILFSIVIILCTVNGNNCFSLHKPNKMVNEKTLEFEKEYEATLKINYGRRKRSADEQDSESVHLELTVMDTNHEVHLRKSRDSIFGQEFRISFDHKNSDENKRRRIRDVTPSKNDLNTIEDNHYTTKEEPAAFSINNKTGEISGYMKGMAVSTVTKDGKQKIMATKKKPVKNGGNDVLFPPGYTPPKYTIENSKGRSAKKEDNKIYYSKPEVLVLWDFRFYDFFKGNHTAMLDYTALYFHIINSKYATIDNPKMRLIVSGMRVAATMEAQDEMMGKKTVKHWCRIYDVGTALESVKSYRDRHSKTLPKSDLAALITDTDLQIKPTENSTCGDGLAGLASIGPCWYHAVSASQGSRNFAGMQTVAHEMGHTLGVGHTKWGVMGGGISKGGKYFDPESETKLLESVKYYGCLKEIGAKNPDIPDEPKNPIFKQKLTFKEWCIRYTYNAWNAREEEGRSPNDNCRDLVCQYFDGYRQYESFGMAFDGTICDNKGGYCRKGICMDKLDRLFYRLPKGSNDDW